MEEFGKTTFWFYQKPNVPDTDRKIVPVALPQGTLNILWDMLK